MAEKKGTFTTLDGEQIEVIFSGSSVSPGTLVMGDAPVILQTDGNANEYAAVKYTTASVMCYGYGLGLRDLFAQNPLDVRVRIVSSTRGELFTGYVSPNTYNQSITGINDAVTIECVDYLGIAQYVPYQRNDSFAAYTLGEAIMRTINLIDSNCYIYLQRFLRLVNGTNTFETIHYSKLILSDAYFYSSPTEPPAAHSSYGLSYNSAALSCAEVLEMIAESLRATWVQVGAKIYLIDYYALSQGYAVFDALRGSPTSLPEAIEVTAEAIADTNVTMSVAPKIYEVSRSNSRGSLALLPDLFANNTLTPSGQRVILTRNAGEGKATRYVVQPLDSFVAEVRNYNGTTAANTPNPSTPHINFVSVAEYSVTVGDAVNSPNRYATWPAGGEFTNYLRLYKAPFGVRATSEVSIKAEYQQPCVAGQYYALRLEIEAAETTTVDTFAPVDLGSAAINIIIFAYIKCGDKYFNSDEAQWVDTPFLNALDLGGTGEWKKLSTQIGIFPLPGIIADKVDCPAGNIDVVLSVSSASSSAQPASAIFVRSLRCTLEQATSVDVAQYYNPTPAEEFYGVERYAHSATAVDIPISFGFPMGDKPFSTVVDGCELAKATPNVDVLTDPFNVSCEMRFVTSPSMPAAQGITFLQHALALGQMGNTALELSLRGKNVSLLSSLSCSALWQGTKPVLSLLTDVKENKSTIKIAI